MATYRRVREFSVCVAVLVVCLMQAATAGATTITKTTTYNPGTFWSDFTYTWSVVAMATDIPYDDVHVALTDRTVIDIGSYSGPGAATIVAGPGKTGTLQLNTAAPGGFAAAIGFSITTTSNPTFVEGNQTAFLTLSGVQSSATFVASAATPLPDLFHPGDTLIAFGAGTFAPFADVDLFQNGHASAQIGFGSAAGDGSAILSLASALNDSALYIGESGMLRYVTPVTEPATLGLLGLGLVGLGLATRRRGTR